MGKVQQKTVEKMIKEPKGLSSRIKWLRDYYFKGNDSLHSALLDERFLNKKSRVKCVRMTNYIDFWFFMFHKGLKTLF